MKPNTSIKRYISGEALSKSLDLPEEYRKELSLQVTIRSVKRRVFSSLSKISLDTKEFKFNRDEANER